MKNSISNLRYVNEEIYQDIYYITELGKKESFGPLELLWKGEGFYSERAGILTKLKKDDIEEIIGMVEDFLEFIKKTKIV